MNPRRSKLSRRERQILDALFRLGEATVARVREEIPDPPGYDAVRTTLRVLEEKGAVSHREEGRRYVYTPTVSRERARTAALSHLVRTFFDGSAEDAAIALLRLSKEGASETDLERLEREIDASARDG